MIYNIHEVHQITALHSNNLGDHRWKDKDSDDLKEKKKKKPKQKGKEKVGERRDTKDIHQG